MTIPPRLPSAFSLRQATGIALDNDGDDGSYYFWSVRKGTERFTFPERSGELPSKI